MPLEMERLFVHSDLYRQRADLTYVRPLYDRIDWEGNLTALLGARGTGKTTLLLQRLHRLRLPPREALYVDLGDLYFQENRIIDFIMAYVEQGGRYLLIDEVHRYGYDSWASELKQAYDLFRGTLRITFTGSAAVRILDREADLSRRALQVRIPGLSFREYLLLAHRIELPTYSLSEILSGHERIVGELLTDAFRPLSLLDAYQRWGYYPFFLSDPAGYAGRVNSTVQLVLQTDLPAVNERGRVDYQQISRLLYAIASSVPFQPNIHKLGERLGMARETILHYLNLLERADIITNLRNEAKGVASLAKPDKIFLNNTNLLYALAPQEVAKGTVRETFFLSHLHQLTHQPHILPPEIRLPKRGDFAFLDKEDRYLFEIGGRNKNHQQIGEAPNHYVVTDRERTAAAGKVPLWLFGLLY
jgi:predicted AAA+ superfamily ATPase